MDQHPLPAPLPLPDGPWLVFATWSGDALLGLGGSLLLARRRRIEVTLVLVGDAENDPAEETYHQLAGEPFGIGEILDWRRFGPVSASGIGELIGAKGPAAVFFPSPLETGADHRPVAEAVWEGLRSVTDFAGERIAYEVSGRSPINRLIDISEVAAEKQAAIRGADAPRRSALVEAINRSRGGELEPAAEAAEGLYLFSDALHEGVYGQLTHAIKALWAPTIAAGPLVSIIIRTKDRGPLLDEALASVAAQTYEPLELVVVNDGGEEVGERLERVRDGVHAIQYLSLNPGRGRSAAANAGLDAAGGDYLIFLDDDDWLDPEHIAALIETLQANRDALAAYSGVRTEPPADAAVDDPFVFNYDFDPARLRATNYLPIHGVLFSRKLLEKGCRFDERLDVFEDWDFWLQASAHTRFAHLDRVTAHYRLGGSYGVGDQTDRVRTTLGRQTVLDKWRQRWTGVELEQMLESLEEVRRREVTRLNQAVGERDWRISELHKHNRNLDERIAQQQQQLAAAERHRIEREQRHTELAAANERLQSLRTAAEREHQEQLGEIQVRHRQALAALEGRLQETRHHIQALENAIGAIHASTSWRLTAPMRAVVRRLAALRSLIREAATAWRRLPNPIRHLPGAYLVWRKHGLGEVLNRLRQINTPPAAAAPPNATAQLPTPAAVSSHIKRFQGPELTAKIRLIAFYLPQFHPIPENDRWWGKGFTEWTNVTRAEPQYRGHHQPILPGDLGFYDLRLVENQRQQVELAKLYGVGGFCFYFYWFAGKRLLEQPILNYLANPELDLPFCLCWANENWTRRWDGLEEDLLIAQQHSPEDDLAFIEYLAKYLGDERYIRIDGKPLLLVYRPGLLPDPRATVERWRVWCRENGVGEIHIAYPLPFSDEPPESFGMDYAVEFPPVNSRPPVITGEFPDRRPDFRGIIHDWSVFPARSRHYEEPQFPLFRGLCPSWDNTARRMERATIFANASPHGFQEWLVNASLDTLRRFSNPDERIVFVNAWNEWAEGACLEPDRRLGYAYLEATRVALKRCEIIDGTAEEPEASGLAIIIHAFYPDVLEQLLNDLPEALKQAGTLFITTVEELAETVRAMAAATSTPHEVLILENHGRDVLPFLKVLRVVEGRGFSHLLKLHTKKSLHRDDGDRWRDDLYRKLLDPRLAERILPYFADHPEVGLVGPEGHVVPLSYYWGTNREAVKALGRRLGTTEVELERSRFIAGTMFYARISALSPLLQLALDDDDFEAEAGQVDGTLAHAIERAIALSAAAVRMGIASSAHALEGKSPDAYDTTALEDYYPPEKTDGDGDKPTARR